MNRVYVGGAFFILLISLVAYYISFRLVILAILSLLSLLTIYPAPTSTLWLVSVIASEYSIFFAGLTLITLLSGFFSSCCVIFGTVIGLITLFLFLTPIIRAHFIAQQLPSNLKQAFNHINKNTVLNNKLSTNEPFTIGKLFRSGPKIPYQTFTYVTYDDITLKLDYYPSAITGKRPCVLVIHGGSWISGSRKQLPELNSHLARIGYHVVAINYRLAPKWKCPAPIEDTHAALNYLRDHADELNIDIDNFILLGRSAGGQIALLSAYTLEKLGIKGAINFYGPVDMIWGYKNPTNPLVLDSHETLVRYVGGTYEDIPEKYKASSPIEFVKKSTVPTLSFHGATDPLVFDEHARRLAAKLKENEVPNYFLLLPWATHGFDYNLNGPGGQLSTYAIEYFLHVVTQK
ncbi:unnamed protein product [Adineta steineri]|uniref:BD-FAE-like domain-containing protein n=1 Tax=Adineta steineri TaxID=433720 RepID=A0A815AJ76_9BILA|nr:unnamed protein product [Adineta steineri]CAF3946811.1 unnamed protein product [Adineta steineri]